jgi:paraquat-inducible protein B
MKTKVSPAIVGAFVIGAFALGIIALLSFGGISFFDKPDRFVVYFDESIHGLNLGSDVKLRGVRVGRVASMNIRYDEKNNHSAVAVVCELSKDMMTDTNGVPINIGSRDELEVLIQRGLRAQLGVGGLATGLLFVQLDFFNAQEYPANKRPTDAKYIVVPAVPSAIAEFQASASEILASLKRVDFAGLSKALTALIGDARKQLEGLDLKGAVEQVKKTGAQIETLAGSTEIKKTFEGLSLAVTELRATIAKIDKQVEPTGAQLQETIAETKKAIQAFNATADEAKKFITTHGGLGEDLVDTLEHLNDAADSVKRLADFLERNPNALLTGKKKPQ